MIGEIFALLATFCFAGASACIAKGAPQARGDNGALLSIVLTCLVAGVLWLGIGGSHAETSPSFWLGIGLFVVTGVFATIIGRVTLFKSVAAAGAIKASALRRLTPLFAAVIAFVVLGEVISGTSAVGIALILVSFAALLPRKSVMRPQSPAVGELRARGAVETPVPPTDAAGNIYRPVGELFGVLSAASYGASYVTRKLGMQHLPDPTLGTLVAALTALGWHAIAAPFSARHRKSVIHLVRDTGRWQFVAAATMSVGQTLQFFALQNAGVAPVAIIGSMEVFISIYFAAYLLRTEPPPSRRFVAATIVATGGVIFVALG